MTIHEAIASGRRFRRPGYPWRTRLYRCADSKPGVPCHPDCSGFTVQPYPLTCLCEHYYAADWEIEPHEEDFASQAESILQGLGLGIRKTTEVCK